jgi:hypothetical protein
MPARRAGGRTGWDSQKPKHRHGRGIAPGCERQIRRAGINAPAEVPQLAALAGSDGEIAKPNQAVTCLLTSFVISNIETWDLPLKTAFRFASALMFRRFFES